MEEKKLYPFRLTCIEDKYLWGSEEFRLADLGYRDTFVHDGWLAGSTLGELMETYLDRLTGEHVFDGWGQQFPFQIRRIKVEGKPRATATTIWARRNYGMLRMPARVRDC